MARGLSWSTIERCMAASRQRKREKERSELIRQQSGKPKELSPTYEIHSLDFNSTTRITKIEFLCSQQYRTIDRYVTQNHVRYPIYSNWKTKTKIIKKTIKLTNQELEKLNQNSDNLIRDFSEEIIFRLNSEELLPSWFSKRMLKKDYEEKINAINQEQIKFNDQTRNELNRLIQKIKSMQSEIEEQKNVLSFFQKKQQKLELKLKKVENYKKSNVNNFFSFGIYAFRHSAKRITKLNGKLEKLKTEISTYESIILFKQDNVCYTEQEIKNEKEKGMKYNEKVENRKSQEYKDYMEKDGEVKPLNIEVVLDKEFISLKNICGLDYKKIIGCYVICNKRNNRCYVGQSKDVLKRLKQHFKGTVPNNVIFAEDYYSTIPADRESIFEIKIIPCETKDELDKTERELIEQYDAFSCGYNGTAGNT